MDFLIGGCASACAVIFSNPMDVVKTRMQLQGEFKELYRNVPHAFYTIAKTEGILALQKGLVPAIAFQMIFNGIRATLYQAAENNLKTKKANGKPDALRSLFYGSLSGITGALVASPLHLIKTQIQSSSFCNVTDTCNYYYTGTNHAIREIYSKQGIGGLWRGCQITVARVGFGSVQLTMLLREEMKANEVLEGEYLLTAFVASNISAIFLSMFMCPFDVMSTRFISQDIDDFGKGVKYFGTRDCFQKIMRNEGFFAFYKGVVPYYLRSVPHSILSLYFIDTFKDFLDIHTLL